MQRTVLAGLLFPSCAMAQASFTGLGHLGTTVSYSEGRGVSGDGLVAVGMSLMSGGIGGLSDAFQWRSAFGMTSTCGYGDASNVAAGASMDGTVIVGWSDHGSFSPLGVQATVFVNGGVQMIGDFASNPTGVPRSYGRAVSADGSTIVGYGYSSNGTEAFTRAVSGGAFVGLGALSQSNFASWAYGVSADGSVVVGASLSGAQETQAFRWTQSGGIAGLGFLPSPASLTKYSIAEAVSADGSVVVGESRSNNSQNGLEAFRWTSSGGMVGLGDLPGGSFQSFAYAMSASGTVIAGRATIDGPVGPFGGGSAPRAFVWDVQNGMRDVQQVLSDAGAPVAGWNLQEVRGVSADGRTLVGTGVDPQGSTQAWIATLPAPSCYANCDQSSAPPILNINDFQCFINQFAAGSGYANCDGSSAPPVLNINDFVCFINRFAAGCQ